MNLKIKMVNGSNVLKLEEKLLWVNLLGGGGVDLLYN